MSKTKRFFESKTASQFYETKKIYSEYIGYTGKLTYDDWMELPDDHKAAALYVHFFNQILYAWKKTKENSDEEDAIGIVCQYLLKNVEKIKNDPKRYTNAYIYRVAFNCMHCINHDVKKEHKRKVLESFEADVHKNEKADINNSFSSSSSNDPEEFAYFESNITIEELLNQYHQDELNLELWNKIEELGEESLYMAEKLADGGKVRGVRGITKQRKQEILESLKPILMEYQSQATG